MDIFFILVASRANKRQAEERVTFFFFALYIKLCCRNFYLAHTKFLWMDNLQ